MGLETCPTSFGVLAHLCRSGSLAQIGVSSDLDRTKSYYQRLRYQGIFYYAHSKRPLEEHQKLLEIYSTRTLKKPTLIYQNEHVEGEVPEGGAQCYLYCIKQRQRS
jgi:hypothetical protein